MHLSRLQPRRHRAGPASATPVSSFDQNPERQLEQTQVSKLFTGQGIGKDTQRPPARSAAELRPRRRYSVVHSMDRLARNLDDLRRLVQKLTQRGVRIEFLKEGLVFTGEDSPMANLMLSVMGAFAEFERALIRERQREGIALAKQRGRTGAARKPCPMSRLLPCGSERRPASPRRSLPASSTSAGKPSTSTSARTTDTCRVA
ncbi:recombinase family protein [Escherichia coli]|uniref:recombinase family protein n=1 Tax=Escherichia coli TaxID=562 RepID=UPI003D314F53